MGHYAHITQDSIVDQVITAHADFIDILPNKQEWIKTSYNTRGGIHYQPNTNIPSPTQEKSLRYNYAGIGFYYDLIADAFYPLSPGPEYYLNTTTYTWELIEE